MKDRDLFRVGVITEPHGIKGEVKIFPTTDEPGRLNKVKEIIMMDSKGEETLLHPTSLKTSKQFIIMGFEEFTSRNDVEKIRKYELYVTRENACHLKKDEYYINDLIGMKVLNEEEEEIGVLEDVLETGANDVYSIRMQDGNELLLPAIKQCIISVDVELGIMHVHVIPGL